MVEVIVKRKIIKKKKPKKPKKPIKKKPTQEQKQKQIINIYSGGALRNPLGIKRQKEKDLVSPLQVPRIYRPISINQHVNSFEVEQKIWRKVADEQRLSQMALQREREEKERELKKREEEMRKQNERYQKDLLEHTKRIQKDLNDFKRSQLDTPKTTSFIDEPIINKSFDNNSRFEDKKKQEIYDPVEEKEEMFYDPIEEKEDKFLLLPFDEEPDIDFEDEKPKTEMIEEKQAEPEPEKPKTEKPIDTRREFLYTRKDLEGFTDEVLITMLVTPPFDAPDRIIDKFVSEGGTIIGGAKGRKDLIDYLVKEKVRIGKEISAERRV